MRSSSATTMGSVAGCCCAGAGGDGAGVSRGLFLSANSARARSSSSPLFSGALPAAVPGCAGTLVVSATGCWVVSSFMVFLTSRLVFGQQLLDALRLVLPAGTENEVMDLIAASPWHVRLAG